MKKPLLLAILCFLWSFHLIATELIPWYGKIYDLDLRFSCRLQQFETLDTSCGNVKRPEFDAFYNFSTHFVAREDATVEMEISALNSPHRNFGLEAFRLTGRYFLLNDVIADPVSLVTGVTLSKIFSAARRNIATFDHGGIAAEAHIAVGKELSSCEEFWLSRVWGVIGLGVADVGSPWLRANIVWERNWWERHQLKIFANSIWGFGHDSLKSSHCFHGYGSIHYQACEVGTSYGLRFSNNALFNIEYAHRVYSRNCPRNVNLLELKICYPLSL